MIILCILNQTNDEGTSGDETEDEGEEAECQSLKKTKVYVCYVEVGLPTTQSISSNGNLPQVLRHVD